MKRIELFAFLLISFGLIFQACNKDDNASPDVDEKESEPVILNTIPEFYAEAEESVYGAANPVSKVIADAKDAINNPKDIDFQKESGRTNELWVLNYGTENTGSSTVIITNPGKTEQTDEYRKDGNSWHFMALATALDFGENGDWGTSQGILDANRRGVNFTGPSLWPGDMDIYAKVGNPPVQGTNGSHLDMIHQSPYGMGICNWKGNEYFVFDGYHGNLTYYGFGDGHYPGGDYHGDGKVIHYGEVKLTRDPTGLLPGHMEMDADKKWLYVVDTDKKRVLKVNIESGDFTASASIARMHNEELAVYGEQKNVEWSVFAEAGLKRPCGLAVNENRVFVSDYETNEIVCFNAEDGAELGRIQVEAKGIMGIAIGPNGGLWYADYEDSKVYQVLVE